MQSAAKLLSTISSSVDGSLASLLLQEFLSLERRFLLRDWEPASLDGGQFVEILSRILYHLDSGNLNTTKSVDDCLSYLENNQVAHAMQPRKSSLHFAKVIRSIYKFRSDRGAVHISPIYSANEMDAKLISENVRWCFSEFLRLYWNTDREEVAKAVREICQFDVPVIARYDDRILVLRTDLSAEEELLLLMFHAGEDGYNRRQLGQFALHDPPSITRALQKLTSAGLRQAVCRASGAYMLTPLGSKRVKDHLSDAISI